MTTKDNLNFKPDLIKIDAEGAEPEVIYGIDQCFSKIQYISADCGPERNGKPTLNEVKKHLWDLEQSAMKSGPFGDKPTTASRVISENRNKFILGRINVCGSIIERG